MINLLGFATKSMVDKELFFFFFFEFQLAFLKDKKRELL